jgi:hypothetical protein
MKLLTIAVVAVGGFFLFRHYEVREYGTQDACVALARAGARTAPEIFDELGRRYTSMAITRWLQKRFDTNDSTLKDLVETVIRQNTATNSQWSCALGVLLVDVNVTGRHEELVHLMALALDLRHQVVIDSSCAEPLIVNFMYYDARQKGWRLSKEQVEPTSSKNTQAWADSNDLYIYAGTKSGSLVWGRPAGQGARDGVVKTKEAGDQRVGFVKYPIEAKKTEYHLRFACSAPAT